MNALECLVPQPSVSIRLPFQDFIFKKKNKFINYEDLKLGNWCGSHLVLWSQMALAEAGAWNNVSLLKTELQVPSRDTDTFLLNISGSVSPVVVERQQLRFS